MPYKVLKDVSIQVDGNKLFAQVSGNKDTIEPKPLIVLNSGYGPNGSKSGTWKHFIEALEAKDADHLVLHWDYVGQGHSDGSMEDLTPFQALREMRAVLKNVSGLAYVDASQIGIYGSSFGGYIGLMYSALYGNIQSLFLKSPASDYEEVRNLTLGEDLVAKWRENGILEVEKNVLSPFDFYTQSQAIDIYSQIAPRVSSVVKIVHGNADTNVPISQSKLLNQSLMNSELEIFDGVNHGYKENDGLNRITDLAVDFFLSSLSS